MIDLQQAARGYAVARKNHDLAEKGFKDALERRNQAGDELAAAEEALGRAKAALLEAAGGVAEVG